MSTSSACPCTTAPTSRWPRRSLRALRAAGLDTPVVVGGIVPPADVAVLMAYGVSAVLGPGASNEEVVATVRAAAKANVS